MLTSVDSRELQDLSHLCHSAEVQLHPYFLNLYSPSVGLKGCSCFLLATVSRALGMLYHKVWTEAMGKSKGKIWWSPSLSSSQGLCQHPGLHDSQQAKGGQHQVPSHAVIFFKKDQNHSAIAGNFRMNPSIFN